MNKFKLWLNRNDFKILIIIIIVLMGHILLKGLGSYYYETKTGREEKSENTSSYHNEVNVSLREEDLEQLDKSSEESQKIIVVIQKIMNSIYQANLSNDNLSLRQDIYNMISDQAIQSFLNDGESISVDSILNYIFYVDDISNYAIGKIYKCNENSNIVKYAIVLRYQKNMRDPVDNYLIINMDYNNNTFSYDGMVSDLNEIDITGKLNDIKNKGNNIF